MKALFIYYLIKLRINFFVNSLKKFDTWLKIVSLFFFCYVFINSLQSSVFMSDLLKAKHIQFGEYQNALLNIILFIVFVLNVFLTLFMGSSYNSLSNNSTLQRLPIAKNNIIISDIIAGVFDIFNVLFIPLYFLVYFFIIDTFNIGNFILFSAVLILFLILVSNIIYLLTSVLKYLVVQSKNKAISALLTITLILALPGIITKNSVLITKESIIYLGSFLTISPTGAIIHLIYSMRGNIHVFTFFSILSYFVLLNIILFYLNKSLIQKNQNLNKVFFGGRRKRTLLNLLRINNPFIRKNVFYFLRSPKMTVNAFFFFAFYPIILFPFLSSSSSIDAISDNALIAIILTFLGIHSISILIWGSNVFAHEYSSVINYFIAPVLLRNALFAKTVIPLFYATLNFIIASFVLIYLHVSFLNLILFWGLLFVSCLVFIQLGFLLSIYFPKAISFTSINGMNTSLISAVLSLILTIIFVSVSSRIYGVGSLVLKEVIIFILFSSWLIVFFYYKKIFHNISKIFAQQKGRIILSCQKKY